MKKAIISTHAPAPIGPYNQAILHHNTLYVSGQIGIDVSSNSLVNTTLSDQVTQVMKNLNAILAEAEMTFDHVVKCSIFITAIEDFETINNVYQQYFDSSTAPARETVEVPALPKNAQVEISLIAMY